MRDSLLNWALIIYIGIAVVIYRYTCTKWRIQFLFHLAHPYICLVCLMLSLNLASFITCSKFPFIILSDIQFLSNGILILLCQKKKVVVRLEYAELRC